MAWDHTHTQWDFQTACWMADTLAKLRVFWMGEPLHCHDYRDLAKLRQRSLLAKVGEKANQVFPEQCKFLRQG